MKLDDKIIKLMQNLNDIHLKTIAVEVTQSEWLFFCYESITTPNPSNHIHDLFIKEASCLNFYFEEFISNPEKASVILAKTYTMQKSDFIFPANVKFMYIV